MDTDIKFLNPGFNNSIIILPMTLFIMWVILPTEGILFLSTNFLT